MVITSQCHKNILFQIRKVVTQIFKTNNRAHHFTEQGEVAEAVDDETEHWPIPPRLREELNKIKFEYRAVPLPVCYVTVGTFAQRGLSSTAKTLRSLSGVRGSEY